VYRDGQIVYARSYGMADLERNVPITLRTVFDIGSTAKQFAAATIVMLAADGKLSLDDDLRRHIPELRAYEQPITIRQTLHRKSSCRPSRCKVSVSTTPSSKLRAADSLSGVSSCTSRCSARFASAHAPCPSACCSFWRHSACRYFGR